MKRLLIATIAAVTLGPGGPAHETGSAAMPVLPADSRDWDHIGQFNLKDGATEATVCLYASSQNAIWRRLSERAGEDTHSVIFPDPCAIHAIYRIGKGTWHYQEVYAATYTYPKGIGETHGGTVRIPFRSRNASWIGVLNLLDGVPVLEQTECVWDTENDVKIAPVLVELQRAIKLMREKNASP